VVDVQIDSHVFSSIGCLRRSPGAYVCWHTVRLADVVWARAVSDEIRDYTGEAGGPRCSFVAISNTSSSYE
jgi:hypothetical protein